MDSHPDDLELVLQSYNVARHAPASPAYHRAAGRVFALPAGNRAMGEIIATTFGDYLTAAKPCRLPSRLASRSSSRASSPSAGGWSKGGFGALAGRARNGVPTMWPRLCCMFAGGHRNAGNQSVRRHWLHYVAKHFPNSPAARVLPPQPLPAEPALGAPRGRWTPDTLRPRSAPGCADELRTISSSSRRASRRRLEALVGDLGGEQIGLRAVRAGAVRLLEVLQQFGCQLVASHSARGACERDLLCVLQHVEAGSAARQRSARPATARIARSCFSSSSM